MIGDAVTLKIRSADPALGEQQILSADEHTRLAGMHPGARPAFITARTMLRTELGAYMGLTPAAVPLRQEGAGRVTIEDFSPDEPPFFSVSHTGAAEAGIAAVAVCESTPIGIDIQQVDHQIEWQRVAERRYPSSEWAVLQAMPPEEGRLLFLTLWAIKEAFVKMEDGKLMPYLRGVELAFDGEGFRLASPSPAGLGKAFIHFEFMPAHELMVACVAQASIQLTVDSRILPPERRFDPLQNKGAG